MCSTCFSVAGGMVVRGSPEPPAPWCLIPVAGLVLVWAVGAPKLSWCVMDGLEFSVLEENCSSRMRQKKNYLP